MRESIDRLLEIQRDKCSNCLYWKTDKCSHRSDQAVLLPTDKACSDGFIVHFINGQIIMKHENIQLSKQIQHLTSQTTKTEMTEKWSLRNDEIEWIIKKILFKRQYKQKPQKQQRSVGEALENLVYEQIAEQKYAVYQDGQVKYVETIENNVPYAKLPWTEQFPITEATPYESTETLWNEVRKCVYAHWDYPESTAYDILTSWIFATYTLPKWKAVPYLFAFGAHETGKTRMLEILAQLSFRGWLALYVTVANLYRPVEAWKPTVFLDETETYAKQYEIRALLNGSYRKGQLVPRQTQKPDGEYETKFYDCFSMKALAGTKELAQTLQSRCITLRMSRATRKVNLFIDEEQTQTLRSKLLMFRFKELGEFKRKERYAGKRYRVALAELTELGDKLKSSRLTELFYPIITMTPKTKVRNRILEYALYLDKQRWEELTTAPEATALTAILQSYGDMEKGKILIGNIANKINENLPINEHWSNRYTSSISQRLGFRKCLLHGRTAIRWNRQLIERLKDDPRYIACFELPTPLPETSPISISHLSQHKFGFKEENSNAQKPNR